VRGNYTFEAYKNDKKDKDGDKWKVENREIYVKYEDCCVIVFRDNPDVA